jgi:hypothetical protein
MEEEKIIEDGNNEVAIEQTAPVEQPQPTEVQPVLDIQEDTPTQNVESVIETSVAPVVEQPVQEAPVVQPSVESPAQEVPIEPVNPAVETPTETPVAPAVEQPVQEAPKKKGKGGLILILVAILALGGFAAWYFALGGDKVLGGKKEEPEQEEQKEEQKHEEKKEEEKVTLKTEDEIKKLYKSVFDVTSDDLLKSFMNSSGSGSFYNQNMQKLFDKDKVLFSSLGLDENGKFEMAIHRSRTAEIAEVKETYENIFGEKSFEAKEYTTDSGFFKCTPDKTTYTCVATAPTGGEGSASGIYVKYVSFVQKGKVVEMNLNSVIFNSGEYFSIKDGYEIALAVENDSITSEANKDVFSKYTYKATFEIDGTGYKFISVEPTY